MNCSASAALSSASLVCMRFGLGMLVHPPCPVLVALANLGSGQAILDDWQFPRRPLGPRCAGALLAALRPSKERVGQVFCTVHGVPDEPARGVQAGNVAFALGR